MIEPLILHEDAAQAAALFARTTGGETVYRPLNEEEFYQTFIRSTDTVTKVNVCEKEGDTVLGFASGAINAGKAVGYITMIVVDRAHRRDGMGTRLLAALETELHKAAPIQSYEITFFNPVNLTWIVPGTPGHDHPNAPGIDVASDGYLFFKNNGYLDTVYQNSFYQPLAGFAIKPKIQARIDGLREHDLAVGYYDKERHFGMEELFDDLGNPLWKTEILGNIAREDGGDPVIIAHRGGKAVGFTGPIHVQESGRGYFAGIGIHSDYRAYGLGSVLFSVLCRSLKEIGASYMTLFTGETNPARYIYQSAGFKIVKTWADMEKKIK